MINEEYTQRDLKRAKSDFIGSILGIVFFLLLLIVSIPVFNDSIRQEISNAEKSVYKEFTFEKYATSGGGYRSTGKKDGMIYVEEEEEPMLVEYSGAFFYKHALSYLKEGMKIKCRVIKMPDDLRYSYKIVEFATEERVFFTLDGYKETAYRVNRNGIGFICTVCSVLIIICIVLLFRYRKKYIKIKEELFRQEQLK